MSKTRTKPSAAEALRDVLEEGVKDSGPIESLPPAVAGQRPKRAAAKSTIASTTTAAGRRANSERRQASPAKPKKATVKVTLPEAIAKKLKAATAKQLAMVKTRIATDANAVIAAPDADGDILIRYVPGWEQGRMVGGKRVAGLNRQFPYLIHKDGSLSGHGYRYRSSAAEAKLKPIEEKNQQRLDREAAKAKKAAA